MPRSPGYPAILHFVDVPIDLAIQRMAHRNAAGSSNSHVIDEAAVRHLASIFEPPDDSEALPVVRHHPPK